MSTGYWITALTTAAAVVACVVLHYEGLRLISGRLPLPGRNHRARIVLLILSLLVLHIMEIWIFGGAYYLLLSFGDNGALSGDGAMSLLDCVYYSATVFTTLGFGDIVPSGAIRFMTGTEAIAGLTFITWSASFTFVVMQKSWSFDRD
jgi:Ion channel